MRNTIIAAAVVVLALVVIWNRPAAEAQSRPAAASPVRWEYAIFELGEDRLWIGAKSYKGAAAIAAVSRAQIAKEPMRWELFNAIGGMGFEMVFKEQSQTGTYYIFKRPLP